MEIRYSREMSHNYMIIEAPEEEGYASKMLSVNTIEGLLKFRTRQTEEFMEYHYEITSRQPLKRILEKRTLSGKELRAILLGILGVLKRVEEYLLKDEQILLDPEYIYIDLDQFTINLCLIPGYLEDTSRSMSKLLEYLLERVDHQDREAVVLAYNLYQISLRENYGMADLLRQLAGEDKIFSVETKKNNEMQSEPVKIQEDIKERDTQEQYTREQYIQERSSSGEKFRYGTSSEYGISSDYPDTADDEQGLKSGKQSRQWLKSVIRVTGCAAAAGIIYWYITGEINIWLFAVGLAAGMMAFAREFFAKRKRQRLHDLGSRRIKDRNRADNGKGSSDNKKVLSENGKVSSEKYLFENKSFENKSFENSVGEKENRWMIYPESEEEHKKELLREEEARIERTKEAGTTLLSAEMAKEGTARLEPLEAGEALIQIPYVPFTIGKHQGLSDACIDKATVSRLHARIDRKEGVYILTDLNSTNGTSVNGYQLQANETVSLGNGDSVYLADVGFKFWENCLKIQNNNRKHENDVNIFVNTSI